MADKRPLNVRCAKALGCKVIDGKPLRGHAYHRWFCGCDGTPHGTEVGDPTIKPYGENTEAGWACTGPLLERFKLLVDVLGPEDRPWVAMDALTGEKATECCAHACAATAEWVAQFGEEARRG